MQLERLVEHLERMGLTIRVRHALVNDVDIYRLAITLACMLKVSLFVSDSDCETE